MRWREGHAARHGYAAPVPRRPLAVIVFGLWTEFVWAARVRNVMATAGWKPSDLVVPLVFVLIGLAVLAVVVRPAPAPVVALVVRGAAAISSVVWVVRAGFIAVHDHPGAFIAVHMVLATISIALASWAAVRVGYDQSRHGTAGHRHREQVAP